MANFFDRLNDYFEKVSQVMRGEAGAASIFPNTSDIGISRELVYVEFLKKHAPLKCNVFLGGFLFDEDGVESKQLDILIVTDTAPRFNLGSQDGVIKSFSPVEGTLGVVSVKSTLNKIELFDALGGIASIPPTRTLIGRVNPSLLVSHYDDWPYKIIYATSGISPDTLLAHLNEYYSLNPSIPLNRRPNVIHVAGSCFILRASEGHVLRDPGTGDTSPLVVGSYHCHKSKSDVMALTWCLNELQKNSSAATQILFSYAFILNKVNGHR